MIRILLVDDDESNRLTMTALLEDEGFDVQEAASKAAACAVLSVEPSFAIVLTDQHLGDGLGSDIVPIVRDRLPHAKVVLMSGSAGEAPSSVVPDGCFTKGDHFEELLTLIRVLCERDARAPGCQPS
jgi:two-component system, response regulator RegA